MSRQPSPLALLHVVTTPLLAFTSPLASKLASTCATAFAFVAAACAFSGCAGSNEQPPETDAGPEVVDAGPFKTADHPAAPQVKNEGGPVLDTPKVIPVYFADEAARADVDQLLPELQASGYWHTVTAEYGVGDLSVGDAVTLDQNAPGAIAEADIVAALDAKITAADPNAIYMFMIPKQTTFGSPFQGECCSSFDGYHDGNEVKGQAVATAFICTCNGPPPGVHNFPSSLDEVAVTISHELAEAATDPDGFSGFNTVDSDHAVYGFLGGGEIGDMCEFLTHAEIDVPGIHLPVQRQWSNKAAKADQDPCVPTLDGEVFFASVVEPTDTLQFPDGQGGTFKTKGIKVAAGETRTIDVILYSSGPLDDWGVQVFSQSEFFGGASNVTLRLPQNHGHNGDKLPLEITVNSPDFQSGEIFLITSTFAKNETLAVGLIGQR